MQERLKAALATAGWTPAEASDWEWTKGPRTVVFDTSSWLEVYVGGRRTDDVPMPIEPGQEASTIARIEGR